MAVVGTAYVVVQAITTGFTQQVQNALQGLNQQGTTAGNSVGKSFSRGAASGLSQTEQSALATYKAINLLIEKSYVMSSAGVALAQVLSTVASGLVVLVAQVGAAAPALIVLPSMFMAIAQAAITMKLAFKGIGAAVGSINKGNKGVSQMPALLEAASAARDRNTRAIRNTEDAAASLIKVYDEELERIEQLKFSSEGAALSQKKAAIELEKARETLARVQDLPPNSRARRSAELAFAEADLNYRQAVDKNKDLAKEVDKVTAGGTRSREEEVKNSEAWIRANRDKQDAMDDQAKAAEALEKANKKVASGGSGGGADPMADLGESAKEFAKYLASLKPMIDELRGKIQDTLFPKLKDAIEILVKSGLFEILNEKLADTGTAIGNAAIDFAKLFSNPTNLKNFSDVLDTNNETIGKMGIVLGNLTTSFITLLDAASPLITRFTDWVVTLTNGWQKTLDAKNATGELTDMFNGAGDVAAQLGDIFGNLFGAIMNIGKAATGPGSGGQLLFDFLEEATAKFKEWTGGALKDGSLEAFFKTTTENFIKLLEIIGIVVAAILKTGDDPGVSKFFDSLKIAVQTLADALGKLSEGGITEGFGKFIEHMAGFIAATTESGSIKTYFGILNTALGLLVRIMENPAFQALFGVLATIHGARLAFGRLGWAVGKFTGYLGGAKVSAQLFTGNFTAGFKNAYNVTGKFSTALKAGITQTKAYEKAQKILWDAQKYGKIAFDGVKGALIKMGTAIKTSTIYTKLAGAATKVWAGIQAAFNAVMAMNPVTLIVIAIVALIAILVVAYLRFQWFRDFVDSVWDRIAAGLNFLWDNIIRPIFEAMVTVFGVVWQGIQTAFGVAWDAIQVAISFVWNNIIQPIFRAFQTVFELVWAGIQTYFQTVWAIIHGAITFAWNNIIRPVFDAIGRVFGTIWSGIQTAFSRAWDFITGAVRGATSIFGGVRDTIVNAFRNAINFIIRAWNGLDFTIPKVKVGPFTFGGFTIGLPNIPELAEGGIINPTAGGTLARIGEAGKAERIEPLDANGLSKRDKALITMLSGGAGGINITVNPSPGMDEVELASLVSRQLAFQLRRGAA